MKQTEWEESVSLEILDLIRRELYLELRYIKSALSAVILEPDPQIKTFATDGEHLYFSTEQIMRVFQKNPRFLDRAYLHSILHCMFYHLWSRNKREAFCWHTACDIAVEMTIDHIDKKLFKRALSFLRKEIYEEIEAAEEGISAAVIYRILQNKSKEEVQRLAQEFYTDDHRFWPTDQEAKTPQMEAMRKKWQKLTRQMEMEKKEQGKDTDEGKRLLLEQIKARKSQRDYREFLKRFTVRREELQLDPDEFDLNYYTYGLRLYKNLPFIEPLETKENKKIQEFVIVIDTSYSTNGTLVENFLKETFSILTQEGQFFADSKIYILQCDEEVQKVQKIERTDQIDPFLHTFEVIGGGNTDFRPAFSYVQDLREKGELKALKGMLYFTDGRGIYPKKRPDYDVAFLFAGPYEKQNVPPWAMQLKLEKEEFIKEERKEG